MGRLASRRVGTRVGEGCVKEGELWGGVGVGCRGGVCGYRGVSMS